jgi:uncharacterized protein (DUF1330 family)
MPVGGPRPADVAAAAAANASAAGSGERAGQRTFLSVDGTPPKRITVQQWESMDKLRAWYDGADYQAALKIGKQYADFRRYAVEGSRTPVR